MVHLEVFHPIDVLGTCDSKVGVVMDVVSVHFQALALAVPLKSEFFDAGHGQVDLGQPVKQSNDGAVSSGPAAIVEDGGGVTNDYHASPRVHGRRGPGVLGDTA